MNSITISVILKNFNPKIYTEIKHYKSSLDLVPFGSKKKTFNNFQKENLLVQKTKFIDKSSANDIISHSFSKKDNKVQNVWYKGQFNNMFLQSFEKKTLYLANQNFDYKNMHFCNYFIPFALLKEQYNYYKMTDGKSVIKKRKNQTSLNLKLFSKKKFFLHAFQKEKEHPSLYLQNQTNSLSLNDSHLPSFTQSLKSKNYTKIKNINMPKSENRLYTVLRSPHIDKKSREQWYYKVYKNCFQIRVIQNDIRDKIEILYNHCLRGSQLQCSFSFETDIDLWDEIQKKEFNDGKNDYVL